MSFIDGYERLLNMESFGGTSDGVSTNLHNISINKSEADFNGGKITGVGANVDIKGKGAFSKGATNTGKVSSLLFSLKLWDNNNEKFNNQESAKDYYIRRYTNINEYKNVTGSK